MPAHSALPKPKTITSAVAVAEFLGISTPKNSSSYQVSEVIQSLISTLKQQIEKLKTEVSLLKERETEQTKQIAELKADKHLIAKEHRQAETQIKILLARAAALGIDLSKEPIKNSAKSTQSGTDLATTQVGKDSQDAQWKLKQSRRSSRRKQGAAA